VAETLTMILAGGKGTRLYPLCNNRAKPALPFGGRYRVIDLVLSNFTNSGFYKIKVLTQFMSNVLHRHISLGWRLASQLEHYVDILQPGMRDGEEWYLGTADAIYQNIDIIESENPDYVFIFGADHIYKMDIRQMLDYHIEKEADLTVSAVPVPFHQAREMGVIEADPSGRIRGFAEKPENPNPMPGNGDMALVSMGNYIFSREALLDVLGRDHLSEDSAHDFGRNIIPMMIKEYNTYAYDFMTNQWPGMEEKERGYWRDIGTIDAYWEANMDLCSVTPKLNLYNHKWPIRTTPHHYPPSKFVFANEREQRVGRATDSLVSEGCIISGGSVHRSVLSPGVRVNSFARVTDSVLMDNVEIGRHCMIKNAIIDNNICVPPHTVIGYDPEHDRKHYCVTESGIVIVSKQIKIEVTDSKISIVSMNERRVASLK
jgi:glucose-1-phosphate adenylyltransferase